MSPQRALQFTFSNTPSNFISLKMPTPTNILERPRLLPLTIIGEVLDCEFLWTIYRRSDYDITAFETDGYAWLDTVDGYVAA